MTNNKQGMTIFLGQKIEENAQNAHVLFNLQKSVEKEVLFLIIQFINFRQKTLFRIFLNKFYDEAFKRIYLNQLFIKVQQFKTKIDNLPSNSIEFQKTSNLKSQIALVQLRLIRKIVSKLFKQRNIFGQQSGLINAQRFCSILLSDYSAKQYRYYKQFQTLSTVQANFCKKMAVSINKRRSVNNLQVIQKIQNNSLVYFRNCEKQILTDCPFFDCKELRLVRSSDRKSQKTLISISNLTSKWEQNRRPLSCFSTEVNCSQDKIYQILMEKSTVLTYSDIKLKDRENKQNQSSLSNISQVPLREKANLQQAQVRLQSMQNLINEKLIKNYKRVDKNMNKLDMIERQIHADQTSVGIRKIKMIEKLISMMETNKNARIREMFMERQKISESREQQKKTYQKKLQKVRQVQQEFKMRKIDEFTAIHQLNGIRG